MRSIQEIHWLSIKITKINKIKSIWKRKMWGGNYLIIWGPQQQKLQVQNWFLIPFEASKVSFPPDTPHEMKGLVFHAAAFWCWPNQPFLRANHSTSFLGVTCWIPNRHKTIAYNSLATTQWKSKWSIVLLIFLHIQHQSPTTIWCFH